MGTIIRLVIAGLLAFFALPWCVDYFWAAARNLTWPHDGWWPVSGMLVAAGMVWWKRPSWLVHTILHETCHALVCWLLLVRIRNFQASDGQGGKVIHDKTDPIRSTIISLAPYTLPLLLLPVMIGHHFAHPQTRHWWAFFAGFFLVHHLHGLFHNIRLNHRGAQADLVKSGRLLSLVVIAGVLLLVLGRWLRELGI